jgi:hypothetical protein
MNYLSGEDVHLLDLVKTSSGDIGRVVCNISDCKGTQEYQFGNWSYLKQGLLAEFDVLGLVHFEHPKETLILDKRAE